MPRKQKQLIVVTALVLAAAFFGTSTLLSRGSTPVRSERAPATSLETPRGDAVAAEPSSGTTGAGPSEAGMRTYAVSLEELPGLSPDSPAGTTMQIWVAWDPPITKQPRIHLLLDEVTLQRILQGLTPRTPPTAILLLRPGQTSDLLYADRYGALSAVVTGSS